MFHTLIAIVIAYLIGSLSFSIILSKISGNADPRTEGSQNAGATNTLRTAGKTAAIIVLLGDMAKGFIAVLIGKFLGCYGFSLGLVALAAVVGHIFPAYFGFKGGKGVATAIGAILGLSFLLFLVAVITFIIVAVITRYASLASLAAMLLTSALALLFAAHYFIPIILMLVLILYKHLPNLERLKNSEENKIRL